MRLTATCESLIDWLVYAERHVVLSDYTIQETESRLKRAFEGNRATNWDYLEGSIKATKVTIQRRRLWMYNSFQPVFVGDIQQEKERALLDGKYSIAASTKMGLRIFVTFMLIWFAGVLSTTIFGDTTFPECCRIAVGGLYLMIVILALVVVANRLGRSDVAKINQFLRTTLRGQ